MDPERAARATSFGAWADDYHRWRPTYSDAAVDWLLPPGATRVAEIGAGTGKMTDRLVERGLDLDVVEPDGRMLALVAERHPGVRTHEAGAAHLPLEDASVDAVVVADAWHWFPKEEAIAEVTRVLRPGGWLGVVWNVPAPTEDWQWRALRLDPALHVAGDGDHDPLERLDVQVGRAEKQHFRWDWYLTPAEWRGLESTISHIALLPADELGPALDEIEQLVADACRAAGTDAVPLLHDALCVRWYPEA
jgi:SAM-dependent methyltransferase